MEWASVSDREELWQLWKRCFGDRDEGIDFYFDTAFVPQETAVLRQDGRIASMLRLFDCTLWIGERSFPLQYVFAAATHPDFQGKGCMSRLLNEVCRECALKGAQGIILVPATPELFGFYKRLGFQTAFYRRWREVAVPQKPKGTVSALSQQEFVRLHRNYLRRYPAYVEQGEKLLDYVYRELCFFGGKSYKFREKSGQGYGICYMIERKAALMETDLPREGEKAFLSHIRTEGSPAVRVAEYAPLGEDGVPYGMCRPLSEEFSRALSGLSQAPYMALMLDD